MFKGKDMSPLMNASKFFLRSSFNLFESELISLFAARSNIICQLIQNKLISYIISCIHSICLITSYMVSKDLEKIRLRTLADASFNSMLSSDDHCCNLVSANC